jgi:hypothetical protein
MRCSGAESGDGAGSGETQRDCRVRGSEIAAWSRYESTSGAVEMRLGVSRPTVAIFSQARCAVS